MENKLKLVTAIITTHNRKELLVKAIDSVLNQTYKNIECIVVDDASTDGTDDYIKEYINEGKIIYIKIDKKDSKGGNYARNIGIKNANGEYIAFLDDDDEWLETKIDKQVSAIRSNSEIGLVYCGMITEKNYDIRNRVGQDITNKKYEDGDLSKKILVHCITTTSTIMIKRDILVDVRGFDEDLRFWQDYELCIRVLQKCKAALLRENLVIYRVIESDKNRLSNKLNGWEESVKYIERKHKDLLMMLNRSERHLRKLYFYIDGFSRARKIKSLKFMFKYAFLAVIHPGVFYQLIKKIWSHFDIKSRGISNEI